MKFMSKGRPAEIAPEGYRWGLLQVSEEVIISHKDNPFGREKDICGKTVMMKKGTVARWVWVLKEVM